MIKDNMLKTIILIGGPSKGTRFRPLSLDIPKPLFPVAGFPMIQHHIEAISQVEGMKEVILIGGYQPTEQLTRFINDVQHQYKILVRYLQEYAALGTGGGMFHFRDQILSGNPQLFFVMNADVCCEFPLDDMLEFHRSRGNQCVFTILGTEATRQQSLTYGCIVEDKETHEVLHYVEKPETFVSTTINCGIYLCSPEIFTYLKTAFKKNQEDVSLLDRMRCSGFEAFIFEWDSQIHAREVLRLEQDVLAHQLAGTGKLFVYDTKRFWSQIKSAGAAIYANRHYLNIYHRGHPDRLARNGDGKPKIHGDVFIHPSAIVHPTATLGPNVTIGSSVTVGAGVRVRESMVLQGAVLQDHCCVLYSVIGYGCMIGEYTRVEGTPNDPNPNKPFAKLDIPSLFSEEGRLNPSITVIGSNVSVPSEVVVLNSIVLPHKDLGSSLKNTIIL